MKNIRFGLDKITYCFAFIFPITPWYCRIFDISAINLICLLYVFSVVLIQVGKRHPIKLNIDKLVLILFILWELSRAITFILYNDYTEILWFTLRTAAVFFAFSIAIKQKKEFLNVIKSILIASFIISIFGIIEELTHFNIFSLLKPENYTLNYNPPRFGLLRILSFTEHTIVYSVYIMFCLSLCIYYMQFVSLKKKIFYRILYILLWINIIFSLSRSAMICTILSQVLILYFQGKKQFIFNILKIIFKLMVVGIIFLILVPQIREMIRNVYYMILAVFNDNYTSVIESTFGGDNLHAQGDRINLYNWVFSQMNGGWTWGHGKDAIFKYSYYMTDGKWTWTVVKENIEVQYLDVLYRYGAFGLITEVLIYIRILVLTLKKYTAPWDKRLSFSKTIFSVLFFYYIQLFAVNQTSERSLFHLIIFLVIVYNSQSKKSTTYRRML